MKPAQFWTQSLQALRLVFARRSGRWWRIMAASTAIQLILVAFAWQQLRHRPLDGGTINASSTLLALAPVESAPTNTPDSSLNSSNTSNTTGAPSSTAETHAQSRANTATQGFQPLPSPNAQDAANAHKHPNGNASHANNSAANTAETPTASRSHNTATSSTIASTLLAVPIPLYTLHYQASISDGSITQTLPDTRLSIRSLAEQRYTVSLNNATQTRGEGNLGLGFTFINSDAGPIPVDVSGGAYLKTSLNPKGFSLGYLGLSLNPDGRTWAWGKQAPTERTHAQFLDRVGLIVYIQGLLSGHKISLQSLPMTLQLPIATRGAIRSLDVTLRAQAPKDLPCSPCIAAHVHADLGEIKDWAVWYDGARSWQPALMHMRMGRQSSWLLTLRRQEAA